MSREKKWHEVMTYFINNYNENRIVEFSKIEHMAVECGLYTWDELYVYEETYKY